LNKNVDAVFPWIHTSCESRLLPFQTILNYFSQNPILKENKKSILHKIQKILKEK
jgi:hypothetical protein